MLAPRGMDRTQLRVQHALQGVLVAVLIVGFLLPNVSVIVNAVGGLAITILPALLERDRGVVLAPGLTLWIAGAAALHALGMIVFYDAIPWWDVLTHLVSGALVAGVGYALVRTLEEYTNSLRLTPPLLALFVVLFTVAAGVLWEVMEMAGREIARYVEWRPVLIVYGLEDTMLDLVVDAIAGVLVALAGAPILEGWVDRLVVSLRRNDPGT
ncbi:MAG: hypothetical protein V5A43_08945 [Haloarculaceae archaeon]